LLLAGCGVNNIPTYDESAKAKWSDVENQYQRRGDLIPNLVETVKGYATQEREVLTQVTEARAKASQIKVDASTVTDPTKFKEYQDAQNALTGALGRLLVTIERYPDLKSNPRISSRCNLNSKARKTRFRSRVAITSIACRPIIRSSRHSRASSGHRRFTEARCDDRATVGAKRRT
jgi:hypothetical protein